MVSRLLVALVVGALGLTVVSAPTVASADGVRSAVSASEAGCPRTAIDAATPGKLVKVRCAGGLAAGTARHQGGKKHFLVRVKDRSNSAVGVKRLRGIALSAACAQLPGPLTGAAACGDRTALGDDACAPFPPDEVPVDPHNPNPPYGDPQKASSLTAMRSGVLSEAVSDKYSKNAVLCAEHPDDMTPEECAVAYWDPGAWPGSQVDCNFLYLRVNNDYWTGLTPMVLNQYGEYLGVTADGKDGPNQHAGPHASIALYNSSQAWLQPQGQFSVNFDLVGGALNAADVEGKLEAALGNDVSGSSLISPVLFHDQLQVDCTPAWQGRGSTWNQIALSSVSVSAGSSFTCGAMAPGAGTAYITAKLGQPTGSSAPAAVYIIVDSDKTNTLRKDPSRPFTADNVIWPNGLPEVQRHQAVPFSIDAAETCLNDQTQDPESCLHLWVVKPKGVGGCNIWFVLELRSPQLLQVMNKYGLATTTALMRRQLAGYGFSGQKLRKTLAKVRAGDSNFTPHISLAKRQVHGSEVPPPWGTAPVGTRDVCTDAQLLSQGKDGLSPFVPDPPQ